jgi:hypothetical protein
MRSVVLTIRTSILAAVTLSLAFAASCSSDEEEEACDPNAESCNPGAGGSNEPPSPIECGAATCDPLLLPFNFDPVAPCCTDDNACGLDSSFLNEFGVTFGEACQARDQPGAVDDECPESAPLSRPELPSPQTFEGCCRVETGTCGYMLDKVLSDLVVIGLGCVDSTPFLEGGTAGPCTPGGGGEGGGSN